MQQIQANGGRLTVDLEYTSYEFRHELEKLEQHGILAAISTTSSAVTYQLKNLPAMPKL